MTYQPESSDLTATGALDLTSFTPGFGFELEEFGFRVSTALVGGIQNYDLVDASNTIIAALPLQAAGGGKAAVLKTNTFSANGGALLDAGVIKIRRRVGGTGVSAGTGTFYVRGRQRLQQRG
jgi:hypothetical protein